MVTCRWLLGNGWPGELNAASGQRPLFISCESLYVPANLNGGKLSMVTHAYTLLCVFNVNFIRNGAFRAKPPPPKQRMQQKRKDPSKEVIEIKPSQVNRENN